MPLTELTCRTAKPGAKVRKLSDGAGLQLWVMPGGSKLWRLAYRFEGRQRTMAIGPYPAVGLADARRARELARREVLEGIDPGELRRETRAAEVETFRAVANEYLEKLRREARADTTLSKVGWLLDQACETLGDKGVARITAPQLLEALRRVERRGRHETANRLRSTIGAVLRYAIATGRAENDPTPALKGALIRPVVRPRAAIVDPRAFGALLRAIDGFEGQPATQAALRLLPLLFPRPGELRLASWREFDLEEAVWTIPAARTKMRRPHAVPLAPQAIAILAELRSITGRARYAFPSTRTRERPLSENTLNAALRRLGYGSDEVTAHGFRATASTLLNESGKWHPDAIERQLAHVEANNARRAYARGQHWDERVRMMAWWARYLDKLTEPPRRR